MTQNRVLQRDIVAWQREKHGHNDPTLTALKLCEEAGEVAGSWPSRPRRPGPAVNLSDLVYSEGYPLVVDPDPRSHHILGAPPPDLTAACLCEDDQGGRYIACITDAFDHLYGCAHEIAGDRYGHTHTERMLTEQARILARWARRLADQGDGA